MTMKATLPLFHHDCDKINPVIFFDPPYLGRGVKLYVVNLCYLNMEIFQNTRLIGLRSRKRSIANPSVDSQPSFQREL